LQTLLSKLKKLWLRNRVKYILSGFSVVVQQRIRFLAFSLIIFSTFSARADAPSKYIVETPIEVLQRINFGFPNQTRLASKTVAFGKINKKQFSKVQLNTGDTILLRLNEKRKMQGKDYYPALLISSTTIPILIDEENLLKTIKIADYKETTSDEILNFAASAKYTIVYVILPQDRKDFGEIKIRHKGQLVDFTIPALGISTTQATGGENRRLYRESSTPQGLYLVFGTMRSANLMLGGKPYLNIDDGYTMFGMQTGSILKDILPDNARSEYWTNEFNLANSFGRTDFRIHNNTVDKNNPNNYTTPSGTGIRASRGCINVNTNIGILINKLKELVGSDIAGQVGKIIVIVKDK
jgi:hypothetical protein